jgi:hypothetical protein
VDHKGAEWFEEQVNKSYKKGQRKTSGGALLTTISTIVTVNDFETILVH